MDLTVVTYGGGDTSRDIFNSLALLLDHHGGFPHPLILLALTCTALWAILKALYSSQPQILFLRFILPTIATISVIMLPTTSVRIEDVLTGNSYKVDNVPTVLARVSELISSIGYYSTKAIETVMHVPNDTNYNSTGMVFGAENSLDISKYQISNAVLEQNLKRFAKQCVFYDLALNRYTLNDLKTTNDLWNFLEKNSSKTRMIPYTDPEDKKKATIYLSCQNAMKTMAPIFEKEKRYQGKQDIVKNLPLTFQALTGIKRSQEELISQQLMMNLLSGELAGEQYAKARAAAQQKNTYQILGALASTNLVKMRAALEAIIYASFLFVIPFSLLPNGFFFIYNWLWLNIWIQLWPPFYAIINYIMHSVARAQTAAIFQGLSDENSGLSFFTSMGLSNLYEDIFVLSGYLAASIPFISYAIVKGGISSFMHLAGSLMTPAHAAATTTAGEQATGNLSLGNMNYGQLSYGNSTGFQRNMAPSISEGYFVESSGNIRTTYSGNEAIIDQSTSKFRMAISSDDAIIDNFQKSHQNAEMITESHQKGYLDSISNSSRNMTDLTSHLSQSQNFSDSQSSREAYDVQESARFLQSKAESLSEQFGISSGDSLSILISARQLTQGFRNIPFVGSMVDAACSVLPEYQHSTRKEEIANSAINIANSEDFQTNYQRVADFANSTSYTNLSDEGKRLVEGVSHSFDEVASNQQQYQLAKSRSDQISDTASWAEQHSQMIRKSLDQDLFNWAVEKHGFSEAKRILTNGSEQEANTLVEQFVGTLKNSYDDNGLHSKFESQSQLYESNSPFSNSQAQNETIDQISDVHSSHFTTMRESSDVGYRDNKSRVDESFSQIKSRLEASESSLSNRIKAQDEEWAVSRLYGGMINNVVGSQNRVSPPLGWSEE